MASRRSSSDSRGRSGSRRRPTVPEPHLEEALARYQSGRASDAEVASLMKQVINTGSIQALQGVSPRGDGPSRVWASIIPVDRRLDIWIDGERTGSASNVALARYRVAAAARPARVSWTDPLTAHWERPATDL